MYVVDGEVACVSLSIFRTTAPQIPKAPFPELIDRLRGSQGLGQPTQCLDADRPTKSRL
jgi:hypothetical protein